MRVWWVVVVSLLFAGTPVRAEVPLSQVGIADRMMVVFKPGVSQNRQRALVAQYGLEVIRDYKLFRALVVRSKPGKSAPAEVGLRSKPEIEMVGRDVWRKWIDAAPTSLQQTPLPRLGQIIQNLPKLKPGVGKSDEVKWGVRRLNAPAAWPRIRGKGVKVAIIDTGIDPTHPDLAGRVKGGYNAIDKEQPWHDDHGHGSHVAGITAGTLDGKGIVGVAPEADLYAVKVLTKDGQGSLFGIMGGIMWCVQNGIQVVNMSLGAPQDNPLFKYAVQQLGAADIPLIAAAGNDAKAVNYPAAYPEAIAVSALCPAGITETRLCPNTQTGIATFSSRGPEVEFIAPGVNIPSSVLGGAIKNYSGTSMASPHVAGLAALAISGGAKGVAGVRAALGKAATKMPGLSPSEQGSGIVDAGGL